MIGTVKEVEDAISSALRSGGIFLSVMYTCSKDAQIVQISDVSGSGNYLIIRLGCGAGATKKHTHT